MSCVAVVESVTDGEQERPSGRNSRRPLGGRPRALSGAERKITRPSRAGRLVARAPDGGAIGFASPRRTTGTARATAREIRSSDVSRPLSASANTPRPPATGAAVDSRRARCAARDTSPDEHVAFREREAPGPQTVGDAPGRTRPDDTPAPAGDRLPRGESLPPSRQATGDEHREEDFRHWISLPGARER
jgi:hypothetical protein